jgi:hypothetical protein
MASLVGLGLLCLNPDLGIKFVGLITLLCGLVALLAPFEMYRW